MRKRAALAFVAALAAGAAFAATGVAASSPVTLTEAAGGTFPKRTWVLSLPAGQRIQASQVGVKENGHGVVDLNVAPADKTGSESAGTALVIDASDSMSGSPITSALSAARTFAARRNVNQRLAVVTFNASTTVATTFTKSQDAINNALTHVPQTSYGTHLYDAVAQAIALVRAAGIGVGSIVVLSDGADTGSKISLDQVTQSARDSNIRVFTVAFHSTTFKPTALQQLSVNTGGSFSQATSQADLANIYDQLGLQLAHEYLVTYNSTATPGVPVKVGVSVKGIGTTSAGYVSPTLATPGAVYHRSKLDAVWKSVWTMIAIGLLIPLLVASALLFPSRRRNSTVRSRVADYVSMPSRRREADAFVSRVFVGTERSLEKTRWWARFKTAVAFADVPFTAVQIIFGTAVLVLFCAWVFWLVSPYFILFALLVPLVVRGVILARMSRKRRLFSDQLPDNLDVLASGLRAGHSLVGAFAVVVNDAPEPSRAEFQRVVADEQLGVPLEDALGAVGRRMKNRDIEQVVLVASVQGETGGNAAEVLDRVTENIRERQDLRRLVSTLTAQGRFARWIVSALPVGLLILISILNPAYVKPLFTHTTGLIMLVFAGLMIIAGSVIIGRIVDIEV